jgi:group I intron endonuclease
MKPEELLKDRELVSIKTKKLKKTGIYIIFCTGDKKAYVGQSRNIFNRILEHKRDLNYKRHKNAHLQNVHDKYGPDALIYLILEECDEDNLLERETHYYDLLDVEFRLNLQPPYDMRPLTEREIQKAVNKRRLKPYPESAKKLISEKLKGRIDSEETKRRKSFAVAGRKKTPEQIDKLRPHLEKLWEKTRGKILPRELYENRKYKRINKEIVKEIRIDFLEGKLNMKEISEKYDLQLKTIKKIRDYKTWKDVIVV